MPEEDRAAELKIFQEQAAADGKPPEVQEKIAEGRMRKWLEEVVLLNQTHVNEDKHDEQDDRGAARRAGVEDRRERRDPALRPLRDRGVARTATARRPSSGGSC